MAPELKRQALLMVGIFLATVTLIFVSVFVIAPRVQHPDRHDETKFGRIYVRLSEDWTQYQRERIVQATRNLSRLGPTFVVLRPKTRCLR
jgi:hypothetical protein